MLMGGQNHCLKIFRAAGLFFLVAHCCLLGPIVAFKGVSSRMRVRCNLVPLSKVFLAVKGLSNFNTIQYNTIQYNTSWGTETPPGTSLQAYFVAHGRSNIVRNLCNCTIPYPLLRHSACGAPVTPRGSDMYPNTLWVGAAVDGVRTHDLPSTKRAP